MDDEKIMDCIRGLLAEDHLLRDARAADPGSGEDGDRARRMAEIEAVLDRLWEALLANRRRCA